MPSNYFILAHQLQLEGNLEESINAYHQAIEVNPKFSWSYHYLGKVLTKLGRLDEAVKAYTQAIELNYNSAWHHHKLGEVLLEKKLRDDAVACFQSAIKINPNMYQSYNKLGELFAKKGLLDLAVSFYRQSISLNQNFCWPYYNLAEVLFKQKKWFEAVPFYQKAIHLHPYLFRDSDKLAIALKKQGRLKEAIAAYKYLIELNPNIPKLHHHLADTLQKLGNLEQAVASYQHAIKLSPKMDLLHRHLGNVFQRLGNLEQAAASYHYAIKLKPKVEDYCNLGLILAEQSKWIEAINYYLQGLKIQPKSEKIHQYLGDSLKQLGYSEEALSCYELRLPAKFLKKLIDWEVTSINSPNNNINHIKIGSAYQCHLIPPKTVKQNIHKNFTTNHLTSPETFVAIVPHGKAWIYKLGFVVITSDNKLVQEVSRRKKYPEELVMLSPKKPPIFKIDGTVAIILGFQNYFTWMCQVLPCIKLLRQSNIDMENIDKFAFHISYKPYQIETLKLLDIPLDKIIRIDDHIDAHPHIQSQNLIVPSPIITRNSDELRVTKWGCEFLRNEFLTEKKVAKSSDSLRIYISRKKADVRHVINEKQVMEFIQKFGFQSVVLESLTVSEQVALLAKAEAVISPHGAGLTNIMFCSPGTKIIEIFSPIYVIVTYWIISNHCQLDYYYLLGESSFNDPKAKRLASLPYSQRCRFSNIFVNINSLSQIMRTAGL